MGGVTRHTCYTLKNRGGLKIWAAINSADTVSKNAVAISKILTFVELKTEFEKLKKGH